MNAKPQRLEVLREGVREEGETLRNPTIRDRHGKTHFLPGDWQVKSCHRNNLFKHWNLVLTPLAH